MSEERISILVAGDESSDLGSLTERLLAENFKVLPVVDRTSIVTHARSEVPDLILLDLQSCFDICRMLKRSFITEPIPIIALLFPAEEADRVAAFELGADDCMAKPYSFRELTLRIRCSLARVRDKKSKIRYQQTKHYYALSGPSFGPPRRKGS